MLSTASPGVVTVSVAKSHGFGSEDLSSGSGPFVVADESVSRSPEIDTAEVTAVPNFYALRVQKDGFWRIAGFHSKGHACPFTKPSGRFELQAPSRCVNRCTPPALIIGAILKQSSPPCGARWATHWSDFRHLGEGKIRVLVHPRHNLEDQQAVARG